MIDVIITPHARRRFRHRVGHKGVERTLKKALSVGDVIINSTEELKVHLDSFLYIFSKNRSGLTLRTVLKSASKKYGTYTKGSSFKIDYRNSFMVSC